jgi:hypothetical protein
VNDRNTTIVDRIIEWLLLSQVELETAYQFDAPPQMGSMRLMGYQLREGLGHRLVLGVRFVIDGILVEES